MTELEQFIGKTIFNDIIALFWNDFFFYFNLCIFLSNIRIFLVNGCWSYERWQNLALTNEADQEPRLLCVCLCVCLCEFL